MNFALFPVAVSGEAVTGGFMPPSLTLFTYMFLHGGWMHVLLNMLFLFVFGDNIEDALGHGRFLAFYLLCGIAGGAAHAFAAPLSNVPLVGASGAIAGVIAAYMMIRPCARITVLIFGFIPISLASYWVLGFWTIDPGVACVQPRQERHRMVGPCRRACGRRGPDRRDAAAGGPPVPVLQSGGRDCACGIKVFGPLGEAAVSLCCTALTAHGVSHRLPAARGGSFPA